jgi:hypothetical protein
MLKGFSLRLKYDSYIELMKILAKSILIAGINLVNRGVVKNKLNYYRMCKITYNLLFLYPLLFSNTSFTESLQ